MGKSRTKLVYGSTPLVFFLVLLVLCTDYFGQNIIKLDTWLQQCSVSQTEQKPFHSLLAELVRGNDRRDLERTGFACNVAENSIVCLSNQQVRIETSDGNITVFESSTCTRRRETNIKPYALRKDKYLLQYITEVKILHGNPNPPPCHHSHNVPAVIFSTGISGNLFHEFNDVIIPLFITTRHFRSRVRFVIEDYSPSFVTKFGKILSRLSDYDVADPKSSNRSVRCYPGVIIGLNYHDNLALNPSEIPRNYTTRDFRQFLAETYALKFLHVSQIKKPTLLLISREKKRRFLNEDEMVAMMRELGFRVIKARAKEASDLDKFSNIVNSCNVLVGAHGAGLTNELFLPDGAVLVQIEPLGVEWAASHYFGITARGMNVQYLRYKIEPEESTLLEIYGRNHSVITDPESVYAKGYRAVRAVYLDQQDMKVNLVRFRRVLIEARRMVTNTSLK